MLYFPAESWPSSEANSRFSTRITPRYAGSDRSTFANCHGLRGFRGALVFLILATLALGAAEETFAGPNAGGVLIVHERNGYFECSLCPPCELPPISNCEDAKTRYDSVEATCVEVYAAFPSNATPRLSGVHFGIDYLDSVFFIIRADACGDTEITTGGWPGRQEGTSVSFATARTESIVKVYSFAAYDYYGYALRFATTPHPTEGGVFEDDSVPPNRDSIASFAAMGFFVDGIQTCPDDVPQGGCCLGDGSCSIRVEAECGDLGGSWLGAASNCDAGTCTTTAACCLPDDSCSIESAETCAILGGNYESGFACDPYPCGERTGACCVGEGFDCQVLTESECLIQGSYFGDFTTCDPNPCEGACCVAAGGCEIRTFSDCEQHGLFEGPGSNCDPDPCPVSIGACCRDDGRFCTIEVDSDCPGSYVFLAGETCNPSPCVAPCCLTAGECILEKPYRCDDEGIPHIIGDECEPDLCPDNLGACCFAEYPTCVILTDLECSIRGGHFSGIGSTCDYDACEGACCEDGVCRYRDERFCEITGGVFYGVGVSCDPSPCDGNLYFGACCEPGPSCSISTESDCEGMGGAYLGDGTDCSPNPCQSTCCLPDGACAQATIEDCMEFGGVFFPAAETCDPYPCSGACCFGDSCIETDPFDCAELGGDYSPGVTCFEIGCPAPEPCVAPFGDEASTGYEPYRSDELGTGPNAGGTLIVHTDPNVVFSSGTDYCGIDGLEDCANSLSSVSLRDTLIVHVLAAFPEGSSPRLSGVTFGLQRNECVRILGWDHCADFEATSGSWPLEFDSGTALTWAEAQTGSLVPIYWFAAHGFTNSAGLLELAPHPTQGAYFYDDSVPAIADPISALGAFGFYVPGSSPCPDPLPGACCAESACELSSEEDCATSGGTFQGHGTSCDPDPCGASETPGLEPIPVAVQLSPPRPNPTSGQIGLSFGVPVTAHVRVKLFDVQGARVATLADQDFEPGYHQLDWRPESFRELASGIYYVELAVRSSRGEVTKRERLVVVR